MSWTDSDLDYLAGLFDGEGHVAPGTSGALTLAMSDHSVVRWVQRTFGGRLHDQKPGQPSYKPMLRWDLTRADELKVLLPALTPRLKVKEIQARALLDLVQHCADAKPDRWRAPAQANALADWRVERDRLRERVKAARTARQVLFIDPGERAGWARAAVLDDRELVVMGHGIAYLKDMALALERSAWRYDVIGYEDYRISPAKLKQHTGSNVPTLQLIGMIRLCAWLHPQVKLVVQQPSAQGVQATKIIAANPVFADIAARLEKLPANHDDSHDGSALRHLATWFWKEYL